jgi:hypothetical protein
MVILDGDRSVGRSVPTRDTVRTERGKAAPPEWSDLIYFEASYIPTRLPVLLLSPP